MSQEKVKKTIKGLFIDPALFTFPFECDCSGECCHYGVYTDRDECKVILSMQDEIKQNLDETQTPVVEKWFEPEEEDKDFASGFAVGTELHNGKCVFLDKKGLCTIQKISMQKQEFKWKNKPIYCILFPLTIFENTLTIDNEHIDRLKTCNKANPVTPIYKSCEAEIRHLLGDDGYEELLRYKIELESDLTGKE